MRVSLFGFTVSKNTAFPAEEKSLAWQGYPYLSHYIEVLESRIHYIDTGGTAMPIVLVHGYPASSYIWREIVPRLQSNNRVIAIDLIGFGKSGKPLIDYSLDEQMKYFEAFINNMKLKNIILCLQGIGSYIGLNYAVKNSEKVKALTFLEACLPGVVEPVRPAMKNIDGQSFIIKVNKKKSYQANEFTNVEYEAFMEYMLHHAVERELSDDEKAIYRWPFWDVKARRPIQTLLESVPFDQKFSEFDVVCRASYIDYLKKSDIPKLMLTFDPGVLGKSSQISWAKNHLSNLTLRAIGKGAHFVQEDHPIAIGEAILYWLKSNKL